MKIINFRVSDEDHALFTTLAQLEYLPLANLIRRMLKAAARDRGLLDTDTSAPAQPAPEPAAPTIPVHEDGSTNYRLVVARARGHALRGLSKSQAAKAMGVSPEFIEAACVEVAKEGEANPVMPWHSEFQAMKLRRLKADLQYEALTRRPVPPDLTNYE